MIMTIRRYGEWHLAPSSLCCRSFGRNLQPMPVKLSCSQCGWGFRLAFGMNMRRGQLLWVLTLKLQTQLSHGPVWLGLSLTGGKLWSADAIG